MRKITKALDLRQGDYIISKIKDERGRTLKTIINDIEHNINEGVITLYFETILGNPEQFSVSLDETEEIPSHTFKYFEFYRAVETEQLFFEDINKIKSRRKINRFC